MALLPDELSIGSIELRRWRTAHLEEVMSAVVISFPELQRWMSWAQEMPSHEEMLQVLQDGETVFAADIAWEYFIFEIDSGELVGMAGLNSSRVGPEAIEISYWVRSDRTARGYATAAARTLADIAFAKISTLKSIEIRMDSANAASAAIPPKLGFEFLCEEDREIRAKAQTGKGLVWKLERPA